MNQKLLNENEEKQIPHKQWTTGCKQNEYLGRDVKRKATNKL